MATLDLRKVSRMPIKILANENWNFSPTLTGAPSLVGATVVFNIRQTPTGTPVKTYTVGNGVTITAADKLAFTPDTLAKGEYYYDIEITTTTGEEIRIKDRITASNE